MFLRNCWYVAAMAEEVGDGLLARTILSQPLVLFRDGAGRAAALEDRCCHRQAPLHKGRLIDGNLECGYHGLTYDATGSCIRVPGQVAIPPDAKVTSFPLVERYGWLWIWMGEAAVADEAMIPDFHWVTDAAWAGAGERLHLKADYQLLVDNLLDLSHLSFLHSTTIGTKAVAEIPATVTRRDDVVKLTRWVLDSPPPPTFTKAAGLTENIDRWQIIEFVPPSFVRLDLGGAPAGTGAPDGDRSQGIERWNLNAITPETAQTTHYFWHECRNFRIDDAALTQLFYEQIHEAFMEDMDMIEAQQSVLNREFPVPPVDINADNAPLQARRVVEHLLAEEQAGREVVVSSASAS